MTTPCELPEPPYYSVIFVNQKIQEDDGYADMADRMVVLARQQPGFLGIDTTRDESGFGMTVSYWKDIESIKLWRNHPEHLEAQKKGQTEWYQSYSLQIAKVERGYRGP